VVHRKGEMSKAAIDAGWPHQVALPSSQVVREFSEVMAACEELKACVRFHWFRRDDVDYVVKCFSDKRHAELFAQSFGGKYMTPETRPR
jgi:hypothetical protein